ncbi:ABC transporter substrate-binding protein [Endomicrobiia bacterium]|nr:ABC transporter substrate-binding protein [Endomicrobiia bacterium]GHT66789.1 ABC transporter substrate-binding protein [Endomicrobiia bacterium]GHT74734.1 ABC transporter substrate-binding protein [Endomicrobiia bacterium]
MKFKIKKLQQICIVVILFLFANNLCAKEYKRIISLAPSVTESLYELGEEQFVKGITSYCPKGIIKKEITGTFLEPNIEKIALLNPDLIIATKDGNDERAVEKLRRLGYEVYVVEMAESFNDICTNYYNLSEKLDRTKEAKKIIDKAKYLVEKIYNKLESVKETKLFWEIELKPLCTAGSRSFMNDYNHYTKTINIYKNIDARYPFVNTEDVIERNPDIIMFVNMGRINSEEIQNWRKYKMISAVKNNRIFIIDSDSMFTPTPLTFAKGVEVLANAVYGDIFNGK